MGEPQINFVVGFLVATVIGVLASFILRGWDALHKTSRLMFVRPPVPAVVGLRATTRRSVSALGADPDASPLRVLGSGCLIIVARTVFLVGVGVVLVLVVYWAFVLNDFSTTAWLGALHAGVLGFAVGNFRLNWLIVTVLLKQMTNPPNPVLRSLAPPNNAAIGANPTLPAFRLVVSNIFEIAWRLVWMLVLAYLTYLALSSTFNVIVNGSFSLAPGGVFST